jgi:monoamine oxidase
MSNAAAAVGGNGRLVNELAKNVPIMYNTEATHVHYGTAGVTVETTGRALTADACVVTVPLGVLKDGRPAFSPPLPPAKLQAIERLGCALLVLYSRPS